jgi:glycosyltransferase involved in cell wall biosynthesis
VDLTLLFDNRFYRDKDGCVFSIKYYNHSLFVHRYLQVFDRIRILARVANNGPRERQGEPTSGDGVEVISLGDWNGLSEFLWKRPALVARLDEYLSKDTAVIMSAPGVVGSLACERLLREGHPYGVEVVGDPYQVFAPGAVRHPLRPFFRWWFPRQLRRQCAGACAAAYVTQQALQRRYPSPAYSVGVSSVEITDAALVSAPRPARQGAQAFTLITVGSLAQLYKAPDVLLDAVATCVREGLDLSLIVVGDGRHRAELEARAAALGLRERVCFRGQLPAGDAVRAQLDKADLFVLPSKTEGLPRAMIEAMARGLPCIGSTVGGIPELLPSEDMVAPGDVPALGRKIHEVVTNPERMARMSARNLETAREYHEDILRERRIEFYRQVKERTEAWLKLSGR